jgi:transposase
MGQRTSVGLDVHARSVVGRGLDVQTGEVWRARLTPAHEEVIGWLRSLPGPVQATYEAGPTGFGLARALEAAGIECVVAAPSRLLRPSGERVKTDAKDALHLARLLAVGQVTAVAVPDEETEAARDLVRAREDVRADLVRARHRVTHLLLRQGIVYAGGTAWTGVHETWLRSQRFPRPALQWSYDAALAALAAAEDRRDRLDAAIAELAAAGRFAPVVDRLACLRGISTLTGFGLAVEIGDWTRLSPATIGAYLGLVPKRGLHRGKPEPGWGDQDWQRPRPAAADRGGLASPPAVSPVGAAATPLAARSGRGGGACGQRQPAAARPVAVLRRPQQAAGGGQHRHRPGAGRLVLGTGGHGSDR